MIGLGSNRLSVCRRGGMSVTQAGRGGMEWLAGFRAPSWASPYSAQATAALKAQFPTQWPTIRDYGFAHPALVPFINEDPMMVMSLIDGLGTRCACTRGNNSEYLGYIDTGIIGNQDTRVIYKGIIFSDPDNMTACFGADQSYNARNFTAWLRYSSYSSDSIGYAGEQIYGTNNIGITPLNKVFILDANKNHWTNKLEDGTVVWDKTMTKSSFTTPENMVVLGFVRGGTVRHAGNKGCAECEIFKGDTHIKLVPFIRNGAVEMLDLVSMTLGDRHGDFEIYESIASPS